MNVKQWLKSLSLKKIERRAEQAVADLLDALPTVSAANLPMLAQRIAEEMVRRGLRAGH